MRSKFVVVAVAIAVGVYVRNVTPGGVVTVDRAGGAPTTSTAVPSVSWDEFMVTSAGGTPRKILMPVRRCSPSPLTLRCAES
jgi:hypothetical protein